MLVRLVIHKVIPVDLMGKCARPLAHMVTAKGRKSSAVSNIMGYSRKKSTLPLTKSKLENLTGGEVNRP